MRPDAGQILEQQRNVVPAPARPGSEVMPREEQPRPAMRGSASLKVTVKQFRIVGNTVYTEEQLLPVLKDSYGKELDFEGLSDAANAVRAYYRANGYFLAQAYLPAQQIRDGVVEIAILEGRIGSVELKPDATSRLRPEFARGILDQHLKEGDLITEAGLERPLLLLSDLPNVVVSSEIGPSTRAIGASDLRVNIKESGGIISGDASIDNAGNRFTGEMRTSVHLNANNLSGFGDQLTLRASLSNERMSFVQAGITAPVGYGGTRAGVSYATFAYTLERDFASIKAHGEGEVFSVYALHPFVRTRNANLIGQISYENKLLKDRIDTLNNIEDRKINTVKLGLVGDFRDRVFGGALNSFSAAYTDGTLDIAPATVAINDQSATGAKTLGKFSKANFDFRRLQRVNEDVNLLFALSGQFADRNLASAEKMSLGGANGVRAYPVGQGIGDQGFLFTTELRYIVPKFQILSGDVTFSGFYDAGRVQISKSPLPGVTPNYAGISGYGVGVSLGKDNDFLLKTSLAWRGENDVPDADTARRTPRVWFQGIKWFE
ncbi:MAG: ShlB/FhaC/HecB family hemolysin secretion/activation protein [Proteobacteria bacterium]|nr:ShlB/FhaC/HecB family hemolysin secretion/activation protein [Pseudomonadota bacterium]